MDIMEATPVPIEKRMHAVHIRTIRPEFPPHLREETDQVLTARDEIALFHVINVFTHNHFKLYHFDQVRSGETLVISYNHEGTKYKHVITKHTTT